jgi:hypothetical protein
MIWERKQVASECGEKQKGAFDQLRRLLMQMLMRSILLLPTQTSPLRNNAYWTSGSRFRSTPPRACRDERLPLLPALHFCTSAVTAKS